MRSYWLWAFLFLFISFSSHAETEKRSAFLEWEPIEGARSYELEFEVVQSLGVVKKYNFNTRESKWSGKIHPGLYKVKIRSKDSRNVPGDWSESSDFTVALANVTTLSPKDQQNYPSSGEQKVAVSFTWRAVNGGDFFKLKIFKATDPERPILTKEVEGTSYQAELDPAHRYIWTISAVSKINIESEMESRGEFKIQGQHLAKVDITEPETDYVRELTWTKVPHAQKYKVTLEQIINRKAKKIFTTETNLNTLIFKSEWPGGQYRVKVTAQAELRKSSETASLIFDVREGDRSQHAEKYALLKKSIDRHTGLFFIARYFITIVDYVNENVERDTASTFSTISGIGGLGFEYVIKNSPWGILGNADLAGFYYNNERQTFATLEANGTYTIEFEVSRLRLTAGLFYKEFPHVELLSSSSSELETFTISSLGLRQGLEYMMAETPKLGLQLNLHLYESLLKVETPNDQDIVPTLSYQIGVMGSYRVTKKFTGMLGYAKRADQIAYKASETAVASGNNKVSLTGDYLSLLAEYSF